MNKILFGLLFILLFILYYLVPGALYYLLLILFKSKNKEVWYVYLFVWGLRFRFGLAGVLTFFTMGIGW